MPHCKSLDLEITDFENHYNPTTQVKLYHLKPSNLKHVEIIRVSDKPTYDPSF